MFGNIRQGDREFTCSDFSNHVDKQNRKFELTFKSDLSVAKEDTLRGYQETFSDFITSSKSRDLCVGPCLVDHKSSTPLSHQIWPYVKQCLHTCTDKIRPLFDLLDVKMEDRSVFYTKATSINMLLRQLISTASRNFEYNNIQGSDSETAIEIDDDEDNDNVSTVDNVDLVVKKIEQFAQDMNTEQEDKKGEIEEVPDSSSIEVIDDNDAKESDGNKIEQATAKRHKEIDNRNLSIMRHTVALLECNRMNELSELAMSALSALDNIERGSLKEDKKVKSFLGRWYEKAKVEKNHDLKDDSKEDIMIERDRIIACNVELMMLNEETKEKEKREMKIKYRVLSVYTKRYNKWFMTSEKQPWNQFMKQEDLKKYRCSVRMIVDGAFEGYEDVALNSEEWPRKHICKHISGVEISNVLNEMYNY
jgi:hypothetical protein